MSHELGSLSLSVYQSKPFQYLDLITSTRLIGDGTNEANNEVQQSGALPNERDDLIRARPVAGEVAEAPQGVRGVGVDRLEDGLERV